MTAPRFTELYCLERHGAAERSTAVAPNMPISQKKLFSGTSEICSARKMAPSLPGGASSAILGLTLRRPEATRAALRIDAGAAHEGYIVNFLQTAL